MSLFSTSSTAGGLTVDVPPQQVWISRATANGAGRATFGDFQLEPRVYCRKIFYGSSAAGQSYALLEGVTGQPFGVQVDVESSDMILPGDRVCIGLNESGGFRPLFAGYMTQAQLQIADNGERVSYRIAGPEWAWGASGKNTGADALVGGQYRRTAEADATWLATPTTITPRDKIKLCRATRCVFNPEGRRNRTLDEVKISTSDSTQQGWVFEEPDRGLVEGGARTNKSAYWTQKKAIHYLLHTCNDPSFSGIANPDFGSVDPTATADVMRDVDVDGMGLFDAIAKVCGANFAVSVWPVPGSGKWGDFPFTVFSRTGGADATFVLDTRGTSMADATPSVNRLEAAKDTSKTGNRVVIYGQGVRHLTLRYNADPSAVVTAEKPFTLQNGWINTEGLLTDFKASARDVVDEASIEAQSGTTPKRWKDRYTTAGVEFQKYAHVFRRFVWNEAAEFRGAGPTYGSTAQDYFVPDLTGIADAKGFVPTDQYVAGEYARRRRPLLDTAYVEPLGQQRVRVKPIVWLTTKYGTQWTPYTVRVPECNYRIDRNMAAVWITVADLAKWRPFDGFAYLKSRDDPALATGRPPSEEWIAGKTFATLLLQKKLWLTVEASIEVDMPARAETDRTDDSGTPHLRTVLIRRPDAYIKSLTSDQSALGATWASFSGMTAAPIDDTTDMQSYANQLQASTQDEQVQASLLAEADYPIQSIGKMVRTITGRNINLANATRAGAQIVAVSLDCESMTVEHLTESAAMELVAAEKNRIARAKVFQKGGLRP